MKSNLLESLNPQQQKAVIATDGPILILAGAGSGKTRVLTYKVAYLILEKKVSPGKILMVTFTNKAAGEMKERISKLLTTHNSQLITNLPFAGTFHSFCVKVLRRDGKVLGINPNFVIYDTDDQKEAIKQAMGVLNIDTKKINPGAVSATISSAKNELINAHEYLNIARGSFQEQVAKIFLEYQKLLQKNSAVDFDDLIFLAVSLFKNHKDILAKYQDVFQYILVDEYQDTNHAQYQLTRLLSNRHKNLCVVGDAAQSIYAFRGADFRNILNFKKDYPSVFIFNLEQNYRSTQIILDAAYFIISKNRSHPVLKLWTQKNGGQPIKIYEAINEHEEAQFIVNNIFENKLNDSKFSYKDSAVLYRTNAQSRVIEEVFLRLGIPYILVGGVRFYERKEIKDIVSYVRLLTNPQDSVSLKRITKLGVRRLEKFWHYKEKYNETLEKTNPSTLKILDELLIATDYLAIYDEADVEDLARLENIKELKSVATQFQDITQFLENVALVEQEYYPDHPYSNSEKNDAVTLMTMHAAKGLEFKYVFMTGMEEGLFPHARSIFEPQELEEERRLCYVGITRSMERLYMSFTKRRLYFGQFTSNQVSRFIYEIPKELTTFEIESF